MGGLRRGVSFCCEPAWGSRPWRWRGCGSRGCLRRSWRGRGRRGLTEGPFYPDHLPLDTDNDLLIINDSITPAVGEVTHLSGRILDVGGEPVRNALVEIWQVDGRGSYLHSRGLNRETGKRDGNFQGYGRFCTAS